MIFDVEFEQPQLGLQVDRAVTFSLGQDLEFKRFFRGELTEDDASFVR